jgi:hypothetical protein
MKHTLDPLSGRQCVEVAADFFEEQAGFGLLLFEPFHYLRRRLYQKARIAQLALGCC